MYFSYALVCLCLTDWIYQLFRFILKFEFTRLINYFSYLSELWKTNAILTVLILIICLVGIPKCFILLRKLSNILQKIIESMIKQTIIINVPFYVYFLILSWKFYLILPMTEKKFSSSSQRSFLSTICQNLTIHCYSSLFTMFLFILGVYNTVTNRQAQQIGKLIFLFFYENLKFIQNIFSTEMPTPMSFIILVLLNFFINIFPSISTNISKFLNIRLIIGIFIILIVIYRIYYWLWPNVKFDIDFTGKISLNDVSQLNATRIYSIFYPRTLNDIDYLIYKAKSEGKTISIRGQAHTMGGQTLPSRKNPSANYVCDLKYLNRVEYDETTQDVLVEAGATWTNVIKKLNYYGRSPVTMQSYCTFSVGGTISVNAHGITSDEAMCESVISIEYVDVDGEHRECSREKHAELFSLIIGGYGLFGIITRLRLKTVSNVKTTLEYIRIQSDQFSSYYETYLNDPNIEIKIARVDLVRPNNILMFLFRRQLGTSGTIADLSDEARVMNPRQHLMYTYVVQHRLFRRLRFALEKIVGRPLDLTYSADRNLTMYESAKPMALLYQPLTLYDDTFILQEYFIPKEFFLQWFSRLTPILRHNYQHIFLLNLTIRFVKKDQLTFLSYTKRNDSYAFVFYFRIKRNEFGDKEVQDVHQKLIQLSFEFHGTFYLPYRQHYSYEQIARVYPMIDEFFSKKIHYDPIELFSNDWYEHYRPNSIDRNRSLPTIKNVDLITDQFEIVQQRRTNSFFQVIHDEKFRRFLRTVFNAEPVHVIFNYVNRAVQNPLNKNDNDVYRDLQKMLSTRQFAFLRSLFARFRQIRQLRLQIQDLLRQQITIFKHLGYCGKIKDIVSIGDGGRCIKELRQILKIKNGRVYIINNQQRLTDIIERNSLFPIGTFIPYDFTNLTDVPIPSESVDLVVCYMGLHHLPQDQLDQFLHMIYRILRPNGLFLFREHDAYEKLKPLLDVAHMVFNVVTGVDYESETKEIRAFRTIEQWRSCVRRIGFQDTFVYDEQEDDPTDDIMIVVRKPAKENFISQDLNEIIRHENFHHIAAHRESNYFPPCEWLVVRIIMQFGQYLTHTPFYFFPYMKYLSIYWSLSWTETQLAIEKFGWLTALTGSPGFLMNIVVGIFLSAAFLQLSFFSLLIRQVPGTQLKPEHEQLILEQIDQFDNDANEIFDFSNKIDSTIDMIEKSELNHIYSIRIPRHNYYTPILTKLALNATQFKLRSISGETESIQLEVSIDHQCLLWFKQQSNMNLIFEFRNPVDRNQTHLVISVDIPYLFEFLRKCHPWELKNSLKIIQIYGHFD